MQLQFSSTCSSQSSSRPLHFSSPQPPPVPPPTPMAPPAPAPPTPTVTAPLLSTSPSLAQPAHSPATPATPKNPKPMIVDRILDLIGDCRSSSPRSQCRGMSRWSWLALSLAAGGCSSCRDERPLRISVTPAPVVSVSSAPSRAVPFRGSGTPGAVRGGTLPSAAPRSGPLPDWDDARSRALAWIEGAGELGIDALVFVDAAGKISGDERAREVVTKRRAKIPAKELAR